MGILHDITPTQNRNPLHVRTRACLPRPYMYLFSVSSTRGDCHECIHMYPTRPHQASRNSYVVLLVVVRRERTDEPTQSLGVFRAHSPSEAPNHVVPPRLDKKIGSVAAARARAVIIVTARNVVSVFCVSLPTAQSDCADIRSFPPKSPRLYSTT